MFLICIVLILQMKPTRENVLGKFVCDDYAIIDSNLNISEPMVLMNLCGVDMSMWNDILEYSLTEHEIRIVNETVSQCMLL